MLVRRLSDVTGSARHIRSGNWDSVRLLLARDGMGFSFHITTLYAGTVNPMWYRHHLEAVYCISGRARLEDLESGEVHVIRPGTLYALDRHDRHVLVIEEDLTCACVFNPPLNGSEVHDEQGAYAPDAEPVPD
jgi:L-ectoine synthase